MMMYWVKTNVMNVEGAGSASRSNRTMFMVISSCQIV